jgi:hypothetical protein
VIHTEELYDGTGTVIEKVEYDTATETVITTVNGTAPVSRSMTPEELDELTARETAQTSATNTAEMVASSDPAVDKLIAVIEALNAITSMTNATINGNPAAVIKDLARECKTIARQLNHEARLTSGRTEDTDTGPVTDV